jgi:hypothetical protein
VADASFSGAPDTLPAAIADGNTATGGWSNYYATNPTALLPAYSRADPSDWVSISWQNAQSMDSLRIYFITGQSYALPSGVEVSLWDGSKWVPAGHVSLSMGSAGQPAVVTFDRTSARGVRIDMTSAAPLSDHGFLGIAELQVIGTPVAYHSVAYLESLSVDGTLVAGFDQATYDYRYTVSASGVPGVSAIAAANGSVLVVAPASIPGTATVTVTSEDGSATQTYHIQLEE